MDRKTNGSDSGRTIRREHIAQGKRQTHIWYLGSTVHMDLMCNKGNFNYTSNQLCE